MRIAIIGGGYSGVAVAINILRRSLDEVLLTLIERSDATGRSVSASRMQLVHSGQTRLYSPTHEEQKNFHLWCKLVA